MDFKIHNKRIMVIQEEVFMDFIYFFQIFISVILFIAVFEYLAARFATFVHEINHYKEAYKRDKCDAIILLSTLFISGKRKFYWKDNKVIIRLIPIKLWKKFEMKGALGRVYFSNEYAPYTNADLVSISKAGIYGSLKGYVLSSALLGAVYVFFCIVFMKYSTIYAIVCSLMAAITGYLAFSVVKISSYFAAGKKPGWSDRAIELNPDGYREYLNNLEPNNIHTYQGISKII